ncbi:MAG: transcriptional repressor [Succinivibrio sp.]
MQRRNSKQRIILREYLQGRIDHPTAETLYKEVRNENPRISLGTVYRNLMYLCSIGEIQCLDVGDGKAHFDPNPKPHAHFYCSRCHRVSDVFIDDYSAVEKIFSSKMKGQVEKCSVSLTGVCEECLNEIAEIERSSIRL